MCELHWSNEDISWARAEKLNHKQKLHRFKQVKWLKKKSGKKCRELLTADIFFIFTN